MMPIFKPMTEKQKANPLGAHLLQHYYSSNYSSVTGEQKISYPFFNLNSSKDIPLILEACKLEGIKTFGLIVVCGGRHRTPVMVDNNDVYIFESLGTEKSKVGVNSVTQISAGFKNYDSSKFNLCTFKKNRQVDSVSCGSESFMTLKQAFRIKDTLKPFIDTQKQVNLKLSEHNILDKEEQNDPFYKVKLIVKQIENLPPQIAKYSQAKSAIDRYPYKFALLRPKESVLRYANKHRKITSIPTKDTVDFYVDKPRKSGSDSESLSESDEGKDKDKDQEKVTLNKRKMIITNHAVSNRREKHARILNDYVDNCTEDMLKDITLVSSGLDLVLRHVEDIPDDLLSRKESNLTAKEKETHEMDLVDTYLKDEIRKDRETNKENIAPKGHYSLTELAAVIKTKRLSEKAQIKLK